MILLCQTCSELVVWKSIFLSICLSISRQGKSARFSLLMTVPVSVTDWPYSLSFARSVNYFMYTLTPPLRQPLLFSSLSLILYLLWLWVEVVCTGGKEIYESRSTERPDAPVPTVSMLPEKNNELATPHPRCSRARKIVNIYYFLLCCKIVRCMWRRTCLEAN